MKKAQGLPLNMIVIAGIVLVVMVVTIAIFTGFFGGFTERFKGAGEKACPSPDYYAISEAQGCAEGDKEIFGVFNEEQVPPGSVCCSIGTGKTDTCAPDVCITRSQCEDRDGVVISGDFSDCSSFQVCCRD